MDQVSLPMRIALLVVLAFAALWFAALRPKPADDVVAPPPAPVAAAPKAAAEPKAKTATKTDAKADAATPAKPKAAAKPRDDRPAALKRVLGDLEAKRTTVLLFWDRNVSDDREVRRAVSQIDRHDGKVKVHVQPITRVGDFEPITAGVPVVTSPTVLVIGGRDRKARAVQGLTVTRELDELVTKALNAR